MTLLGAAALAEAAPLAPEARPRAAVRGEGVWLHVTVGPRALRKVVKKAEREEGVTRRDLARATRWRPRTRADCADAPRPCPFVGCKHHLFLDVTPTGSIQFNFPGRELEQLTETCALDVAERGGLTLEAVGELVNLNRRRIHQIEGQMLARLRRWARPFR